MEIDEGWRWHTTEAANTNNKSDVCYPPLLLGGMKIRIFLSPDRYCDGFIAAHMPKEFNFRNVNYDGNGENAWLP